MNPILTPQNKPDYFVAQFPGGGQRGFATVLLLDYFKKKTGLPTHQIFPYVTTGSVGILIASALYLPHPDYPYAARMSAAQLVKVFPDIAARTPKKAAFFKNSNDRTPFAEVIRLFIGDAKLKDLLGTVFFSSHEIGGVSQSHKTPSKIIHPETGEVTYDGDPESRILDYALAGTALPTVFTSYQGHIDLAFANSYGISIRKVEKLFPSHMKGAFIRVGNFRDKVDKLFRPLNSGGIIALHHIMDAVSDDTYAETIAFSQACFANLVFNLEQEISSDYPNPPKITANITTKEQFQKIRVMTTQYIEDNKEMLEALAKILKEIALERMITYPKSTFGIPPEIQEFPLPEISDMDADIHKKPSYAFGFATGRLLRGISAFGKHSLKSLFSLATSPPVVQTINKLSHDVARSLKSWDTTLLPSYHKQEMGNLPAQDTEKIESPHP